MTGKGLILLLLSALAPLQGQEPLDVAALKTLHTAGVSAAELDKLVTHHGVKGLDQAGLDDLRKAGVDAGLLARLDADLRKASPKPLDVEGVLALVQAGVDADRIIERIRVTDSRFDLTIDQIVDLARQRVPAGVIKEMRSRGRSTGKVVDAASKVTIDDVIDMSKAKMASTEIIRRIKKTDSRFDLVVDDLLDLSRQGVAQVVLKELWARRDSKAATPADPGGGSAATVVKKDPRSPRGSGGTTHTPPTTNPTDTGLSTHREPSGGFSLNVPTAFSIYREGRNANSLVSFTDGTTADSAGLPDAELQILRYRSRKPEWLVERNLENIAQRFLTMLKSSYVKKGLSLTYSDAVTGHVSGQPARSYKVGSSARDGSSHEGRLVVTWQGDQVFVLSYAVRSDLVNTTGRLLDGCLRSFTFEAHRTIAIADGQDPVTGMFEAWREAVTRRDFALYRELFGPGFDTAANRRSFVDLADRLADPGLRLTIGTVQKDDTGAKVECKIIGPTSTESLQLAFAKDGDRLFLRGP